MSNASKSIFVFGIYIICTGLILIFAPNMLLALIGLPIATEVWVRALGIIGAILGLYYIQAARENLIGFYRMTIWGRVFVMLGFTSLAVLTPGSRAIILVGLVDFCCAIWTWLALQQDEKKAYP